MSENKRNKNLHSTPLVCKAGFRVTRVDESGRGHPKALVLRRTINTVVSVM